MRRLLIWIMCLMMLLAFTKAEQTYEQVFGSDYHDALHFLALNKKQLEVTFSNKGERELAIPVVFPELIRHSMTKDFLETAALEMGYAQSGSGMVDFSIGPFQMKPSFFEALERVIATDTSHQMKIWQVAMRYPNRSDFDVRTMRLKRLKSLQWQMWYLKAFCQIASAKLAHASLLPTDKAEHIRLLAAAYNAGFQHPASHWAQLAGKKFFPHGARYKGNQYAYSDVSVDFYKKYWSKK